MPIFVLFDLLIQEVYKKLVVSIHMGGFSIKSTLSTVVACTERVYLIMIVSLTRATVI